MNTLPKARAGWTLALASACAAAMLPACSPKSETTLKDQPTAEMQPAPTVEASDNTVALGEVVLSLRQKALALPGRGTDAHRDAMYDIFGVMIEALTILEGPAPSGAFRQQVRAIESSRGRLTPDSNAATIEPAIGTGLRAAEAALTRLAREEEFSGASLDETLKKLSATVDSLDTVRLVGRPYVAADASNLIADAVQQMADKIAGRSTDAPTTAESPAAPPAPAAETPAAPAEPAPAETPAPTEPAPAEAPAPPAAPDAEKPAEEMPAEEKPAAEPPAPAEELNK